jgi:protein-S-isoprenylcysteine O-methyltransferase Ste14
MSRAWIALRSIVYATLFLVTWGGAALLFRRLDKEIPLSVPNWLTVPGIALAAMGTVLAFTTIGFFIFEGFGTPAVFDPPTRFVPHGPFRFVRNPMYIGGLTMLLGWSLCMKSVAMVLFSVGAFLIVHTFVVFVEEPGLRKRFGQEYEDFLRVVPRWIPRLTLPPPSK